MRDIRARHGEPDEQPLLAVDEPTELPADDALEVAQLKCDLTNRTVIGQAMGILMQHYALPDDQALALLVTQSRDSGIELCVVAAHVVQAGNDAALSRSPGRHGAQPPLRENADEASRDRWLLRSGEGDQHAFAAFYDDIAPTVFSLACHLVGDLAAAAAVTHDTFVTLWKESPGFNPLQGSATTSAIVVTVRRAVGPDGPAAFGPDPQPGT